MLEIPVHAMNNVREMATTTLRRNMLLVIHKLCKNVSLSSGLLSFPCTITDILCQCISIINFTPGKSETGLKGVVVPRGRED